MKEIDLTISFYSINRETVFDKKETLFLKAYDSFVMNYIIVWAYKFTKN